MASSQLSGTRGNLITRHPDLELRGVTATGKELGRGGYGRVFQVTLQGTLFAAKEIYSMIKSSEKIKEYFFNECVYSSRLRHPNIVQLVGVYYPSPTDELPWLVMELMKSSLNALIESYAGPKGKDIPFHYKRSILVDIGQGLQFMHSKDIIHRDLSSNNILLTKDYVAKIGDLAVAKVVDPQNTQKRAQKLTQAPGTVAFMPPEALSSDSEYGPPLDVFSLGCVCIHLVSLQWPMPEAWTRLDETTNKMILVTEFQRREKYLAKFNRLPPELKILIEECLKNRPKDRPIAGDVVERLRNIKCNPLPHENDDLLQLHTSLIDCEEELAQCIREKDEKLAMIGEELAMKDEELAEKSKYFNKESPRVAQELAEKYQQLGHIVEEKDQQLAEKDQQLTEKDQQLAEKDQQLIENDQQLEQKVQQLAEKDQQLTEKDQQLAEKDQQLIENDQQLEQKVQQLAEKDQQLTEKDQQLAEKDQQLIENDQQLEQKVQQLAEKDQELEEKDQELEEKDQQLTEKDQQLAEINQQLVEMDQQLAKKTIENQRDKVFLGIPVLYRRDSLNIRHIKK